MTDNVKTRGVFEKVPGSNVWWIQFLDAAGRRRREKVGSKSAAKRLVERRRSDARLSIKCRRTCGPSRRPSRSWPSGH